VILEDRSIVFKISDDKSEMDLLEEVKLLEYLKSQNFPYSIYPLHQTDGSILYHLKNKVGLIFDLIEGKIPVPSEKTSEKIGKSIASLHNLKTDPRLRPYDSVGFGAKKIIQYTQQENCPEDFLHLFEKTFTDRLKAFSEQIFPTALIHGDLYFDNTLFDPDGNLLAILDFEQAGIGPIILDIGISISGSCLENGKVSRKFMEAYLKGYESVRKLAKLERDFLNEAVLVGLFSISLWRIKRFKEGNLDPTREDSYKDLLIMAKEFKDLNPTT
jgi:homoserine kinase type II